MTEETYYLVESGNGYFLWFGDNRLPYLTTDPVAAARFPTRDAADATCHEIQEAGWEANIVVVTHVHRFVRKET